LQLIGKAFELGSLLRDHIAGHLSEFIPLASLLLSEAIHKAFKLFLMTRFTSTCLDVPLSATQGQVGFIHLLGSFLHCKLPVLVPPTKAHSDNKEGLGEVVPNFKLFSFEGSYLMVGQDTHNALACLYNKLSITHIYSSGAFRA